MTDQQDNDADGFGPSLAAVGAALRAMRVERGLGVADVAAAVGCAPGRVASVEDGRTDPDFELLVRLAHALDSNPSDILRRAERDGAP